jgi:hypothetical protein
MDGVSAKNLNSRRQLLSSFISHKAIGIDSNQNIIITNLMKTINS